jgi:hypothetical protein
VGDDQAVAGVLGDYFAERSHDESL